MAEINTPTIVAEITALHDAYERALVENDIPTLNRFFWDSPHVVRFGVSEHLYGAAEIASYRQGNSPVFTQRQLLRRTVITFGTETASVMSELSLMVAGQPRHSRQSQVWIRFATEGWKIVSAHVSNALTPPPTAWAGYSDRVASALGLTIDPAHKPGVVVNLERAAAIAGPFLAFQLPSEAEPAPVFKP